jgi:hypothetical protein
MAILLIVTIALIIASGVIQHLYVSERMSGCTIEVLQFCVICLAMFLGSAILVGDIGYLWIYRTLVAIAAGVAAVVGMRKAIQMKRRNVQ